MTEGEDPRRDSVRNEVDGHAGPVVQAGSVAGDVVIGADPARGSRSQLDDWTEGLARAVQAFWRAEEAQRQIHDPIPLPVRWHTAGTALTDHWANIRRRPAGAEAEPLSLVGQLEQIAAVYERIPSRRLVVLGPAGSGKTVLAGRLALDVLAARRPGQPVPVIVSIGAWNPATTSLHTWLVEQLIRDYPGLAAAAGSGDSSSRAAALVADGRILPVLDGFDEIESGLHAAAVRQLNTNAEIPLVITSREAEYAAAVRGADVVTAAAVVQLEELTRQDLADYLPRTAAGHRTGMWDAVLERMRTQPDAPDSARLHRVLTNPLMVFLARTVYSDVPGQDPAELLDPDRFPTEQVVQQHLLAEFVPATYRFDRPDTVSSTGGRTRRRWSADQARGYLTYLANHLHRAGTRDLAWWQLRDTIPRPRRTLVLAVADALVAMLTELASTAPGEINIPVIGLVVMLTSGLAVAVAATFTRILPRGSRSVPRRAILAVGTGLITGFVTRLVSGFAFDFETEILGGFVGGGVSGTMAWFVGLRTAGPQPSRTRFRIRGRIPALAGRFGTGFTVGLAASLMLGLMAGIASGEFATALVNGLVLGIGIGLVFGLVAMLAYGFEAPLNADEVASPVESVARDRGNSLRKMFAVTLVIGGSLGLLDALVGGNVHELVGGPAGGLGFGLAAGWLSVRVTSAWFFWMVLVRGWLPLTGQLPWRVRDFLTDAHQRGVLRRTGPVYQFRHATLQDHLTTEAPPHQPRSNR